MSTALLIGATGLVGSHLLERLLSEPRFTQVVSFSRRPTGRASPKLTEHLVDFGTAGNWASLVRGDVAFSALGTTLAQAGSQEAQRVIDYDYQLAFAKAAAAGGVKGYALCSSSGADVRSRVFYSRMKGELDRDVQTLGFERVRIVRPSLLAGHREKARTGEKVGSALLGAVNALGLARKFREIPGDTVAKAMINALLDPTPGTRIYTLEEVFREAERQA